MLLFERMIGLAVPAVETGTLNRCATILTQAGFASRHGAIKAVEDTGATFTTAPELAFWLNSDEIEELSERADWPSTQTKGASRSPIHRVCAGPRRLRCASGFTFWLDYTPCLARSCPSPPYEGRVSRVVVNLADDLEASVSFTSMP
jgi:hypothetical protein